MNTTSNIRLITTCAIFTAIMCILCPLSIPIGPIPVSLQILIILLTTYILGTKPAFLSFIVYLLLGAVGLPVFSGYQGGLAKLAGPTGGFLIGFAVMILIAGMIMEKSGRKLIPTVIGMTAGIAVDYAFGTFWFVFHLHTDVWYALTVCVFPFVALDLSKMVVSILLGKAVRSALIRAQLLS